MLNGNGDNNLTKQQYGKLVRQKFFDAIKLEWGDYESIKWHLYKFSNGKKVVTLYSSLNRDRWWYGVTKNYWKNWADKTDMVLLMGDSKKCTYKGDNY